MRFLEHLRGVRVVAADAGIDARQAGLLGVLAFRGW